MAFVNPYAPQTAPEPSSAPTSSGGFVNPYAVSAGEGGGGMSPSGFLGNIAQGVQDVVGGAVGILGAGIHDIGKGLSEILPGEQQIEQEGLRLDDIGKAIVGFGPDGQWDPAKYGITGDIWRRYSPLLPGGPPASETFRAMYEEPVSFALDALTIGTVGATAGAQVGASAVKGAGATATATRTASMLQAAGYGGKAAARAGTRAAMDELAAAGRLTAFETLAKSTLPRVSYRRVGDSLRPAITALNPVLRPVGSTIQRITTEPLSKLESRVATMGEDLQGYLSQRGVTMDELGNVAQDGTLAKMAADYRTAKALLDDAKAQGMTRLATDAMAERSISYVARKLSGELNGKFLVERQNRQRAVSNVLKPWLTSHPEIATRAAGLWQRLDIDIDGMPPAHWAGRSLEFEGLGPRHVTLVDGPGGTPPPLRVVIDPAVRAASNPQLLAKTDSLVAQLNETAMKWTSDPKWAEMGYDVAGEVDSVNRLIDHLNDAVDRRHASDLGQPIDPALLAMDDMRILNLEQSLMRWRNPGELTPSMILDRAYLPLRAKYGAKANIDGVLEGGPETKAIDDAMRGWGEAAPIYFPHMDPSEVGAWEFFRSKRRVGGARLAADPSLKKNQAKLLERGSYITDPMEAYSRRAARAVRAEETYRTLFEFATRLGRPIDSPSDLGTNERLFAPELARIAKRTEVRVQDLVDDATSKGVSAEEAVWGAVKDVTEKNQDELAEMLAQVEAQGIKMWAVPKAAADRLEDAATYAKGWGPKGVQMFYDSTMQAWRQLTLFTRPAYVTNQFLGNTAFAMLQGSGLRTPLGLLARRANQAIQGKLGRSIDDSVLNKLQDIQGFDELGHGLFGSEQFLGSPRNPAFASSRVGQVARRAGETKAGRFGKGYMEATRQAAVEIDNAFRASGFVTAAERASGVTGIRRIFRQFRTLNTRIDKLLDGGFGDDLAIVKDAVDEAKRFFGDYSSMGPFQRHVVRRYLFPWWGFTRHNLLLMTKFPLDMPGRAEIISSIHGIDEEYRKTYGPLPDWLDAAQPLGPPGAEVPFFSLRGGSPFEGVFQPWTTQLSPLPKVALERATGRNQFTDLPFSAEDVITPFGSDQPYRIIRDEAGNVVNVEAVEGDVLPGIVEHLLRQLPPYSYAERFASGDASTYDNATLIDLLQGQGIRTDAETGEPLDQEGRLAVLGSLAGVPINQVDVGAYQERLTEEEKAALSAAIARFGGQ